MLQASACGGCQRSQADPHDIRLGQRSLQKREAPSFSEPSKTRRAGFWRQGGGLSYSSYKPSLSPQNQPEGEKKVLALNAELNF